MPPIDTIGTNGAIRQPNPGEVAGALAVLPWAAYPLAFGPLSPIVAGTMTQSHQVADGITYGGSATAVLGGLVAAVNSPGEGAAVSGILIGLAGLITAVGAALRPWLEERRAARKDRWERHDLAEKLHQATLRIELQDQQMQWLSEALAVNRGWISAFVSRRPGDPLPPTPPPTGPLPPTGGPPTSTPPPRAGGSA